MPISVFRELKNTELNVGVVGVSSPNSLMHHRKNKTPCLSSEAARHSRINERNKRLLVDDEEDW